MKKLAALVALALIAFTGIARAETCTVADPSGTPLNVRKSPGGAILGALSNGARVTTRDQRGDWIRIIPEAAGKSGWVWREYLKCPASANGEKASLYVCKGHSVSPPDPDDSDPVVRTLVLIERDVPLVSHTTKSGKVYLRSEQYPRGYRGWSDRNGLHWSGTSAQSGRSMFGTLEDIYAAVPHARYIERVYSGNRLETEIVMGCELDQNGELLVDIPAGIIHAEARTLPPSMLGLWCDTGKVDKETTRYMRTRAGKCVSLEISDSRWTTFEDEGCEVVRVKQVGRAYQVLASCGGEGIGWDEKITFTLDGRALLKRVDAIENERPTELGTLACRSHRSTPPDLDTDPVVITLLTFDKTFFVSHTTRSGKTYVRGDQYRGVQVWTPGGDEIVSWSGMWRRNPSKRMIGSLASADGGGYRYTEKVYDGGRLETTTISDCAPADGASGEAPTPPQADQRASSPLPPATRQQLEDPVLEDASAKYDEFALGSFNRTVSEVAKALGNQTQAAQFIAAAKGLGLGPDSPLTGELLSDPEKSRPLAAAIGIGSALSPEQWRMAHQKAYHTALQRQEAAAQQRPPSAQPTQPMASDPGLPRWLMDEPRAKVRRTR